MPTVLTGTPREPAGRRGARPACRSGRSRPGSAATPGVSQDSIALRRACRRVREEFATRRRRAQEDVSRETAPCYDRREFATT